MNSNDVFFHEKFFKKNSNSVNILNEKNKKLNCKSYKDLQENIKYFKKSYDIDLNKTKTNFIDLNKLDISNQKISFKEFSNYCDFCNNKIEISKKISSEAFYAIVAPHENINDSISTYIKKNVIEKVVNNKELNSLFNNNQQFYSQLNSQSLDKYFQSNNTPLKKVTSKVIDKVSEDYYNNYLDNIPEHLAKAKELSDKLSNNLTSDQIVQPKTIKDKLKDFASNLFSKGSNTNNSNDLNNTFASIATNSSTKLDEANKREATSKVLSTVNSLQESKTQKIDPPKHKGLSH